LHLGGRGPAVAAGGVITFSCGPDPVVITMTGHRQGRNARPEVVLDGGGKVTLSGGGQRRILYMDTCDQAQGWTTSHCQDQSEPQLTVQNLTFEDGNSTGQTYASAVAAARSSPAAAGSRWSTPASSATGATPPARTSAARPSGRWSSTQGLPVYIVDSTFGGAPGLGGVCSNGGALSSIGVSWVVLNSVLTYNSAIGDGANPARSGTPGGGSGGAIYTDGEHVHGHRRGLDHRAQRRQREGGGALFFVSNDRTGTLAIENSTLRGNPSNGFSTAGYPGIFFLGSGKPSIENSTLH
jgi:hypothetical protein